ncbi:serine hydrolase domain-containing protein [Marinifilum caeruleilacunae]|uniref:Class A beta-lactamase-related serine hydrolase n=1 Tax=Marinifilum caeruleilacunae TaxID=2499076 RepID=A0ABX1WYK7_9BACT|nr:serine hydrolase domain-containing protein [Marinifilum caeruleilacunae]NOU61071.1 class A beta-lactamase-related serine hydrolase [Marinifilum caeruleilacunae]
MKKFYISLSIFFALSVSICFTAFSQCTYQHKLDSVVELLDLPGAKFSIIFQDGRQENYASGYADSIRKERMNLQHVMFSGSIGKTYAAAVLFQLVEEGKVDLKEKFFNYCKDECWLSKLPNIGDITVEMLLQHTSGLPRYIENEQVWISMSKNPDKVWSYKDRLSHAFEMDAVHKAGEGWAYSDTNYLLIGMLIEKVTKMDFYEVANARILAPLDFEETYASLRRDIPRLPNGYSGLDDFFHMPKQMVADGKYAFNPQMEWTGGGFASTTSDLAKWAKLYYEALPFSDETLEMIITPNPNGVLSEYDSYGMGSFIFKTSHGKAYGHSGFVPGFRSIFVYFPDHKIAAAFQTNCDTHKGKMTLLHCVDEILKAEF